MRWEIWKWLTPDWWGYLLEQRPTWRRFWCRVRGHRCGPIWYRQEGTEPDMRCKGCGEYLG